ncbi:FAD-binding oxidoreductase [Pseudomonas oryzihabitans]|uniref:NAD(P)/FAD-dependent oxidoreductase n=1 Tax=Pseudomonas oryzihabitans TaxID=47885 RepID=UPI002895B4D5|nr:FAD-binding oxidoreductase [Pseudomonas oryzihabitans]MDT3723072.1 FAD-binding oxidoreductase [Pseudomonas oryzihabitans]
MTQSTSRHIAVIGSGIVGACTALALIKDGFQVTIIEPRQPGGEQAASYGNGAFLSPASIIPMSMPGLWKKVPGYLLDPNGPFTIRWRFLLKLAPWLVRFVNAGATRSKVACTARILSGLLASAPARHQALAAANGLSELIRQQGLLYVYPDRQAFAQEALAWQLRLENGVQWTELDGPTLQAMEPDLCKRYTFGILVESGGHCLEPGSYVQGLVNSATTLGAKLVKAKAQSFHIESGRLLGVSTDHGMVHCDGAVIAAGVHSKALAALAGDHVLLESERGYHVQVALPHRAPRIPIMPSDGKMANTLTRSGLRASGQVELASIDTPANWRRADILLHHLLQTYPGLNQGREQLEIKKWLGHRPSTPDGLPVIAQASATPDIVYAFGHGHVGLASGPMTGEIVASIFAGRAPPIDITPFSATRFH